MTPELAKQQSHNFLARRAAVLTHIIGIGFGRPGEKMKKPLHAYNLLEHASDQ